MFMDLPPPVRYSTGPVTLALCVVRAMNGYWPKRLGRSVRQRTQTGIGFTSASNGVALRRQAVYKLPMVSVSEALFELGLIDTAALKANADRVCTERTSGSVSPAFSACLVSKPRRTCPLAQRSGLLAGLSR